MLRTHNAAVALEGVKDSPAFNLPQAARHKLNQHATLYTFPDGSKLQLNLTRGTADAWHPAWLGTADDIGLGPVKGVPIRANRQGA